MTIARLDPSLDARLAALFEEGRVLWHRFDDDVRSRGFHPFVAADYDTVLRHLIPLRAPGQRFLEWGSATGVIAIMADLLGFEAYGIEIDTRLVETARDLARRHHSGARFAAGSFLPTGYVYRTPTGDTRTGTIESGVSGYLELDHALEDFDVVYGFPWTGEAAMMRDLMRRYGQRDARLILHGVEPDVTMVRGRLQPI